MDPEEIKRQMTPEQFEAWAENAEGVLRIEALMGPIPGGNPNSQFVTASGSYTDLAKKLGEEQPDLLGKCLGTLVAGVVSFLNQSEAKHGPEVRKGFERMLNAATASMMQTVTGETTIQVVELPDDQKPEGEADAK